MANYLVFLALAYGILALAPLALLVVVLLRLDRLTREVASLRSRLDRWAPEGAASTDERDGA